MITPEEIEKFKQVYTEMVEAAETFMHINKTMREEFDSKAEDLQKLSEIDEEMQSLNERAIEFKKYLGINH
tara:strand:- start:1015 stop:1227 length:213 start_codon:yes stop_codon:yes gene_type:complete